jgi:ABC-2 type transport system ATP-binding protein
VQLAGPVEDLLAGHRTLVGPRTESTTIPGVGAVIRASHTDRQSTMLVRTDADFADPAWTVHEVSLEGLVLAYLAAGDTRAISTEGKVTA